MQKRTTLIIFLVISLLAVNKATAQQIDTLYVIPSNPSTSDSVSIVSETTFPMTPCDLDTYSINLSNDSFQINATYHQPAIGMPAMCHNTDTFSLGLLSGGNYHLEFDVNSGNDVDTLHFTVGGPQMPEISGPTDTCTSITATYSVSNPESNVTYSWNCFGSAECSENDSIATAVTLSGTDTGIVEVTATNPMGNISNTKQVALHTPPDMPQLSGPSVVCEDSSVEFNVSNHDTTLIYTWNCFGSAECDDVTNNIYFMSDDSALVSVNAKSPHGCGSETFDTTFAVSTQPNTPQISGPQEVCNQDTANYTVSNYDTNLSYEWHCSGSAECQGETGEVAEVVITSEDSAFIEVYATSPEGCVSKAGEFEAKINPLPVTPQIGGPTSACETDTFSYIVSNYDPEFYYEWDCSGSAECIDSTGDEIEVVFSDSGSAVLNIAAISQDGCGTAATNYSVYADPAPDEPVLSGPLSACQQDSVNFTIDNYNADFDYNWNCYGSAVCDNAEGESAEISFSGSDSAHIEVTASSIKGCGAENSVTLIEVNSKPDIPQVSGPESVCIGDTVLYSLDNYSTDFDYTWNCIGNAECIEPSQNEAEVVVKDSGQASIEITATSPAGCGQNSYQIVPGTYPEPATPEISGPEEVCEGDSTEFSVANFDESFEYVWDCSGSANCNDSIGENIYVNFDGSGTGEVQVSAVSPEGCGQKTAMQTISITETPGLPELDGPDTVMQGDTATFEITNYNEDFDYSWDCLSNAKCLNDSGRTLEAVFHETGTALIELMAGNECSMYSILFETEVTTVSMLQSPVSSQQSWNVYPNPSSGNFVIRPEGNIEGSAEVFVYSASGKTIFNEWFESDEAYEKEINLPENTAAGMYILQIRTGQETYQEKLLIE